MALYGLILLVFALGFSAVGGGLLCQKNEMGILIIVLACTVGLFGLALVGVTANGRALSEVELEEGVVYKVDSAVSIERNGRYAVLRPVHDETADPKLYRLSELVVAPGCVWRTKKPGYPNKMVVQPVPCPAPNERD